MRVSKFIKPNKDILIEYIYDDGNNISETYKILQNIRDNSLSYIAGPGSSTANIQENQLEGIIKVFSHEKNKGKGAAIHTGIQMATGDVIVIQDADLEYDPNEFNILLKPMTDGFADVVYGSRFMGGNPHRILFFWHSLGNKTLTFLSNALTNLNLTDMETCYKMFSADIIKGVKLQEKRFGFEPEVTAKIAKIKGIRIYEVGISYYGRTYEEGKKIGFSYPCTLKWIFL